MRGLILILAAVAAFSAPTAMAASFNCAAARTPDERAICADRTLNDRDVELTTRYSMVLGLVAMGMRGDLQDEQRAWLIQRHACRADRTCLKRSYDRRIARIQAVFGDIASHGPF